jgi:hypothetical protein
MAQGYKVGLVVLIAITAYYMSLIYHLRHVKRLIPDWNGYRSFLFVMTAHMSQGLLFRNHQRRAFFQAGITAVLLFLVLIVAFVIPR